MRFCLVDFKYKNIARDESIKFAVSGKTRIFPEKNQCSVFLRWYELT